MHVCGVCSFILGVRCMSSHRLALQSDRTTNQQTQMLPCALYMLVFYNIIKCNGNTSLNIILLLRRNRGTLTHSISIELVSINVIWKFTESCSVVVIKPQTCLKGRIRQFDTRCRCHQWVRGPFHSVSTWSVIKFHHYLMHNILR